MNIDTFWMEIALSLAQSAKSFDEVPIGAIIINNKNQIIGCGFNQKEKHQLTTSHAEMIAIEQACRNQKNWRLIHCKMYVTLEPCLMCAGAIYQSRIEHVIYGTKDPKAGALGSLYNINSDERLNHRFEVTHGILESECAQLLKDFFRHKRQIK